MAANPLVELGKVGQSVWYDQMRRALLKSGELAKLIREDGLRGLTSNPTIFEKAIGGSNDYTEELGDLARKGSSVSEIYQELVVADISNAADVFCGVYTETAGIDGYCSLEVSPNLAFETQKTIDEAKKLFAALNRPNVMVKIPATPQGIPAIEECIAAGLNINVTLIFARDVYQSVAEAYIRGLERRAAAGLPVDKIASVASFFVSRIDTAAERELTAKLANAKNDAERQRLNSLFGKVAIANAKLAYQSYQHIFHGERFAKMRAKGARPQRQLWASTGTKNPKYSDVLYVEQLIGPETVDTVPPATFNAFRDHGKVELTLEKEIDQAFQTLSTLEDCGISLKKITDELTKEGVESFAGSFAKLLEVIEARRDEAMHCLLQRHTGHLAKFESAFNDGLKKLDADTVASRIWKKDPTLWKQDPAHREIIKNALGWLAVVELMLDHVSDLTAFAGEIKQAGYRHVVGLGMGGSGLCPDVLGRPLG